MSIIAGKSTPERGAETRVKHTSLRLYGYISSTGLCFIALCVARKRLCHVPLASARHPTATSSTETAVLCKAKVSCLAWMENHVEVVGVRKWPETISVINNSNAANATTPSTNSPSDHQAAECGGRERPGTNWISQP